MIKETIRTDLVAAMKAKETLTVETLRGALAAFTNELVATGKKPTDELTDDEALKVLKRLSKQRKDAAEQFNKGGRPELAQKEEQELVIIEKYLPQQASVEAIERVVQAKITELGITDASGIGKLTGAIMKELGGNADGNVIKEVINRLLQR